MLDPFFMALLFFWLDGFGGGTGAGGAGRIVVTPPPGARGGRQQRIQTQGYHQSEKRSLHRIHL